MTGFRTTSAARRGEWASLGGGVVVPSGITKPSSSPLSSADSVTAKKVICNGTTERRHVVELSSVSI